MRSGPLEFLSIAAPLSGLTPMPSGVTWRSWWRIPNVRPRAAKRASFVLPYADVLAVNHCSTFSDLPISVAFVFASRQRF